jgi:tetratricopeptide (TPR) repeat protein
VLIHLFNAVLIYFIPDRITGEAEKRLELPLLAALLFAAHPINTEAVCWIAGRTDPLAALFVLAAAYFLTLPGWREKRVLLLIPAGCIFLGGLSKEVAFFFFPVAYLATFDWFHSKENKFPSFSELIRNVIPFSFFAILYLYLRQVGLPVGDRSVSILLTQKATFSQMSVTALATFGFYEKKLFFPLPLNFAIVSYSAKYVWLALAVILLLCWSIWEKRGYFSALAGAFFLILPAVLVAVKPMAWTPVAERYLYAPSALFTIAVVGIIFQLFNSVNLERFLPALFVATIIISSVITVKRNLVWQDNYLLYSDAVAQSPDFARIRNELGVALALRGESTEASRQFEHGKQIDKNYLLPIINLANIKFREGNNAEAIKILRTTYKEKKNADVAVLKLIAKVNETTLAKGGSKAESKKIFLDLIETYQYIYTMEKEPSVAYRVGQLLLLEGETGKAAHFFEAAYKGAPDGEFYKAAAKKLADKYLNK